MSARGLCSHGVRLDFGCSACVTTVTSPPVIPGSGVPEERERDAARARVKARADEQHRDRMDALRLHLARVHHNVAAAGLTNKEAVEHHHHEHRGPGGLRNHDQPEQLHEWTWFGGVRGTPVEERTGKDPWGNADCWCVDPDRPHYRGIGLCVAAGMVPATLRGVSDVQAEVREPLAMLRAYLEDLDARFLESESSAVFEALGRIEAAVRRGEQR